MRTPLDLSLALFIVLAVLSTMFVSVNHYKSRLEVYKIVSCAMLFWLMVNQPATAGRRRVYVGALIAVGLVVAWIGAREYLRELSLGRNPSWRIFATFFNPNETAGFLELVIPVAAAAFLWSRSLALRIIAGFCALLTVVALLLTASRGGWLSLAGGMFVFALLAGAVYRRTRLALAGAAGVVALIILVALAVTPLRVRLLSSFSTQQSSNMFRYLTWRGAATMAAAHPWLGVGPLGFEFAYPSYATGGFTRMAHQSYLQVAAETGLPGGIAFVWMLGAFFWLAGKGFRRLREQEDRLVCAACIAGVLAFCIHSFLDYGWYIGAIAFTAFALFGLSANAAAPPPQEAAPAAVPKRKRRRAERPAPAAEEPRAPEPTVLRAWQRSLRLSAPGRWAALVVAAAVAFVAAEPPVRAYLAENEHRQGRMAENQGNQIIASQHYRSAVRLAPGSGEYHRELGRMLGAPDGIKELERATELEPTNALNYVVLAKLYEITGPWDEAAADYQRAIELNPNYLTAYRGLAELEAHRGRTDIAISLYRRMADIEQSPYERYKALEQRVEPEYAYAHYALGRAALERGDLQAARGELERALAILQQRETLGRSVVEALMAAGEYSPWGERELAALKARVLWRLAELWARAGDVRKADSLRVQARQLDPGVRAAIEQEPPLNKQEAPSAPHGTGNR